MGLWEPAMDYETGLALSVKPLDHGRIKFKIYAEYRDIQGDEILRLARHGCRWRD